MGDFGSTFPAYRRLDSYLFFSFSFLFFSCFSNPSSSTMSIPIFVKKDKGNPPNARSLREVQIRGGLVPPGDYPGTTDYQTSFKGTPLSNDARPFVINPPMNLATNGRPAAKNTWTFPLSENQYRYQWPRCEDIDKLPWVKDLN